MTTQPVVEPQGTPVLDPVVPPENTGNPAWNDLLEELPTYLRDKVTPHLKKWDDNFQTAVGKAKEPYLAYQALLDGGVDTNEAVSAVQLLRAIEADPTGTVKAIQEAYGLTKAEAQAVVAEVKADAPVAPQVNADGTPVVPTGMDPTVKAEFDRLNAANQTMAQFLVTKQNNETEAKNAQELETYLTGIVSKHPNLPEKQLREYVVVKLAQQGMDGEEAAQELETLIAEATKTVTAPNNNAPVVLGSGGSIPSSQQTIPANASAKDRQALVVQMLTSAKQT